MKIHSPTLDKLVGVAGSWVLRAWLGTVHYKVRCARPELDPNHPRHGGRYIYAFWHESILAMAGIRKIRDMSVLISRHQDGEYITQIARRLGAHVVRGSSTRGGQAALLGMLRRAPANHLLITPDGPRGPRRQLQRGAVYLSARAGLPIVPVGCGFSGAWRASSWDRFVLPVPYSVITCVVGSPIRVPAELSAAGLEWWRRSVESALLACTETAEAWAGIATQPSVERQAA